VSSDVKDARWIGDPLPRGRHKLPREAVLASQRERLLRAMAELVGEQGYEATTVPQVIAAARVSRNSFYELFDDKTDCMIALCDEVGTELVQLLMAFASEPDWETALRRGLHAYTAWWQERPAFARTYLIELPTAGQSAMEDRARQYERFKDVLRLLAEQAREKQPDLPPLSDVALTAAVVAPTELVAGYVRAGRLAQLGELEDDLFRLLVTLLAGGATAGATD
jgi:AcrR family transcriptional regulator